MNLYFVMHDVGTQQDSMTLNLLYLESSSPGNPTLTLLLLIHFADRVFERAVNAKGTKELISTQR